jgi:hypothetical protein
MYSELRLEMRSETRKWSASRPGRFFPGYRNLVPDDEKAEWPQSRSGSFEGEETPWSLPGVESRIAHPIA